jgi:hypothetical protein
MRYKSAETVDDSHPNRPLDDDADFLAGLSAFDRGLSRIGNSESAIEVRL